MLSERENRLLEIIATAGEISSSEMNDFSLTTGSFQKLQSELKAGKIVRNPFAKLYGCETTITVIKSDSATDHSN